MHRTLGRDLGQPGSRRGIDAARNADHALEAVDLARSTLGVLAAILAVLGRA
jgi:hypothetical protein